MVSKNIQLTIGEDQVGQFIGARGINVKKFIIGATKRKIILEKIGQALFYGIANILNIKY